MPEMRNPHPRDDEQACPCCGQYYTLSITAPSIPHFLAEHGTDTDIDEWEEEHDYNVLECTACGWSSDEED